MAFRSCGLNGGVRTEVTMGSQLISCPWEHTQRLGDLPVSKCVLGGNIFGAVAGDKSFVLGLDIK